MPQTPQTGADGWLLVCAFCVHPRLLCSVLDPSCGQMLLERFGVWLVPTDLVAVADRPHERTDVIADAADAADGHRWLAFVGAFCVHPRLLRSVLAVLWPNTLSARSRACLLRIRTRLEVGVPGSTTRL